MADNYNVEETSIEIQEIIGTIPHWVTRYGMIVVGLCLSMLLFLSNYITIPDHINAKAHIFSKNQPFKISWYKSEPNIDYSSKVSDNIQIKEGDTLLTKLVNNKPVLYFISPLQGHAKLLRGTERSSLANLLIVIPKYNNYVVQLYIPIEGAGKVKRGNKVIIRLNEYPDSKFGYLIGFIQDLIFVSVDNKYRALVKLPKELVTNIGHKIPLQSDMSGNAEVIVNHESLFSKISKNIF